LDYTRDDFRNVIDVNLIGSFLCAQGFAREFMARNGDKGMNGGRGIVTISEKMMNRMVGRVKSERDP